MSNQAGSNFKTTQITVQNYDQLQSPNDSQPLDQQVPQVAIGGRYDVGFIFLFFFSFQIIIVLFLNLV